MNILNKILNKIRKKAYSKNPFNLSRFKKARELTPEEWFAQNKDLIPQEITDVNQEIGTVEQPSPIEQQPVDNSQVDERIQNSIHNYVINSVRGVGGWNIDDLQPSPDIYEALLSDESGIVDLTLKNEVKEMTGINDPTLLEKFKNVMMRKTKEFLGEKEKIETDISTEEIQNLEKENVGNLQNIDTSLADLFSKSPQYIKLQRNLATKHYRGDPNKAADHAKTLIDRNLSSPTGNNKDQRMAFFTRYPEEMPDEAFNLIMPLLAQSGYTDINSKEDLKSYDLGMAGSAKAKGLSNIINQGAGQILVNRLSELINSGDRKIYDWVSRSSGFSVEKPSLSTQVGEGEEETTMEDLGVGKSTRSISGDESKAYLEARKDHINSMTEIFVSSYLEESIQDSQELSKAVHKKMISNAKQKKEEKGITETTKTENIADKMLVYLNTAIKQIKPFFKKEIDKGKIVRPKIRNIEGNDYTTFLIGNHKINIPKKAIASFFFNIEKDTGKKPYEHFINGELPTDAKEMIKDYATTTAANWVPDWNNWINPDTLTKNLNNIGRIKFYIKYADKNPEILIPGEYEYNSLSEIEQNKKIYQSLKEEDKTTLKNNFIDDNVILGFIGRTRRQHMYGKNSIQSDWSGIGKKKGYTKGKGIAHSKLQAITEVKEMIKNMKELKDSGVYTDNVFRSFFGIMGPHADIISGRGKEGNGIGFDSKSISENYHYLIGTKKEEMDKDFKLRNEVREHNKKKKLEEIEQNENLSDTDRAQKKQDLKYKWRRIEKSLEAYKGNTGREADLKKLKEQKILLEKTEINRVNRNAKKKNGVDENGKPILDEEDKKEIFNIQNKVTDINSKIEKLERKINRHKDRFSLDRFASYSQFKIVYSMFLQDSDRIEKLANMMNKYNNIKMAANAKTIEHMINDIICKYENILNI